MSMLRILLFTTSIGIWLITVHGFAAVKESELDLKINQIRYQVTAIEHNHEDNNVRSFVSAYEELVRTADDLGEQNPDSADCMVWEGITRSVLAKYKGKGLTALALVRQAKIRLERAIVMDPQVADGAAYNALAMLYAQVPSWPVSFGNSRKAELYFQKAVAVSSNLDTNYRYGEFLINNGRKDEGLAYLQKALAFPDRENHREDPLKREDIMKLLKDSSQ
jgi:tetratricopeptide (TPR) repeat protein